MQQQHCVPNVTILTTHISFILNPVPLAMSPSKLQQTHYETRCPSLPPSPAASCVLQCQSPHTFTVKPTFLTGLTATQRYCGLLPPVCLVLVLYSRTRGYPLQAGHLFGVCFFSMNTLASDVAPHIYMIQPFQSGTASVAVRWGCTIYLLQRW